MSQSIHIRVAEAKQRDAGRGKARINTATMLALQVEPGDIIAIHGKRLTSGIVWQAYEEDQGQSIIRIDGLIRKNAGVRLREFVTIEKAEVNTALKVELAPVDMRLNVDHDFRNFLKQRLLDRTVVEGDAMFVVILGTAIPLTVTTTTPHGIVQIDISTRLHLYGEPDKPPKLLHKGGQVPLILAICLDSPKTPSELVNRANEMKIPRIHWHLQHLVQEGYLEMTGTDDDAQYTLTPLGTRVIQQFIMDLLAS